MLTIENSIYYIIGAAVILLAIAILIIANALFQKRKRKDKDKIAGIYVDIVEALGKIENIVTVNANGSRMSLTLINYDLINQERLKELGINGIIKSSNKVTLLVGNNATLYCNSINEIKNNKN